MIKKADINDLNAVTELMLCLWKGHDRKELEKENDFLKKAAAFFAKEID